MYVEFEECEVLSGDPVELVRLLYTKAIDKLNLARSLGKSRLHDRNRAIAQASEVVIELQASLDGARGGEIAANLERLYEYIQQRLAAGLGELRDEPLIEAMNLLGVLADGWREAAPHCPACAGDDGQLAGAGRTWTL